MSEMVSAEALRESEELHRITLLSMSDAVFITDDEGAFTFICPNVDVIFGYGHDEVRAMARISRLLGRELVDAGQLAAHGEIQNIEHTIKTKSGSQRHLLVHVKPVSIKRGTMLYACRDITERKRSEQALRRNEQRLTLALEAAGAGTWDWLIPSGEMNWSYETHRILGGTTEIDPPSFEGFLSRVHPLDRDRVMTTMTEAMQRGASYETEFRVLGFDDVERWIVAKGRALRNGKPLRMLGVFVDFTERHRIEQELRDLSGRLIDAHEQERSRLARELHDDACQQVAVMAMDLEWLRRRLADGAYDARDDIARLSRNTTALGAELHRVAHAWHPARLEQFGLEACLRTLCKDVVESGTVAIELKVPALPPTLSTSVALCLYRVVQEALHNIVKHSRATQASVLLTIGTASVSLEVIDNGVGFGPGDSDIRDALGLVSMRERVWLVGGEFVVASQPGAGTRVKATVPLDAAPAVS